MEESGGEYDGGGIQSLISVTARRIDGSLATGKEAQAIGVLQLLRQAQKGENYDFSIFMDEFMKICKDGNIDYRKVLTENNGNEIITHYFNKKLLIIRKKKEIRSGLYNKIIEANKEKYPHAQHLVWDSDEYKHNYEWRIACDELTMASSDLKGVLIRDLLPFTSFCSESIIKELSEL